MRYNEFSETLKAVTAEFLKVNGRPPETVRELEEFVDRRVIKAKTRGLKSLAGIGR